MIQKIDLGREYGLVLEGGGAKGAYQIGAWKALREAGVKIKGVSGTSVGALNGALICMDEFEKAEKIWEELTYSRVLSVEEELIDRLKKFDVKNLDFQNLADEARRVIDDRGLDITPLKELLAETVDEEKIRNSPMEFFATTFSVTDRKEVNVDMKALPEGSMKDMLLASAYLPAFKNEKIDGKTYLDGGSVNNVPIDVLAKRGYKDIIVIRIYGIGMDKEKFFDLPDDVTLYRIAPRKNLGGILEFDGKKAKNNMLLGYYDAMKLMYGLYGEKYYIDLPYTEAYYFDKLMSELEILRFYMERYIAKRDLEAVAGYRAYTEKIFPAMAKKFKLPADWDYRTFYGAVLEICARKMKLPEFHVYTAEEIMGRVHKLLDENRKIGDMPDGWKHETKESKK